MLEFSLVGIGLVMIIISFFLSEKLEKKKQSGTPEENGISIWTDKDEKNIRERISAILAEKVEESLVKTDDHLGQISNEKIIAVSEFSDQILEKINHNHSEVVFLYDMLNEKEIEIKELIKTIETTKTMVKDTINLAMEEFQNTIKEETEKPKTAMDMLIENKKTKKVTKEKIEKEPTSLKKKTDSQKEKTLVEIPVVSKYEVGDNKNSRILKLYDEGKSIIEISKILGMGQGEVKLVIDLFQGARG